MPKAVVPASKSGSRLKFHFPELPCTPCSQKRLSSQSLASRHNGLLPDPLVSVCGRVFAHAASGMWLKDQPLTPLRCSSDVMAKSHDTAQGVLTRSSEAGCTDTRPYLLSRVNSPSYLPPSPGTFSTLQPKACYGQVSTLTAFRFRWAFWGLLF